MGTAGNAENTLIAIFKFVKIAKISLTNATGTANVARTACAQRKGLILITYCGHVDYVASEINSFEMEANVRLATSSEKGYPYHRCTLHNELKVPDLFIIPRIFLLTHLCIQTAWRSRVGKWLREQQAQLQII